MWILGLKGLTKTMQDQMRVQKFMKTVVNPDLQIRGQGEGGRPDLEIGGGGLALRASVWSKNKGDPGPFPGSANG